MPLLNGTLQLRDIRDVERLCRSAMLEHGADRWPWQDQEDCLAYLIERTWELSLRYDPSRDRHPSFANYAHYRLTHHIVADWQRQHYGDQRYNRPTITSLNEDPERIHLSAPPDNEANSHEEIQRLISERDRYRTRDMRAIRDYLYQRIAA